MGDVAMETQAQTQKVESQRCGVQLKFSFIHYSQMSFRVDLA